MPLECKGLGRVAGSCLGGRPGLVTGEGRSSSFPHILGNTLMTAKVRCFGWPCDIQKILLNVSSSVGIYFLNKPIFDITYELSLYIRRCSG